MFAIFTVRGAKLTNTTPVDSPKTGDQTILSSHYVGEDPKASEGIKKLNENLDTILKLLQGAPPRHTNSG